MKNILFQLALAGMSISLVSCDQKKVDLEHYPNITISNNEVQMKVYLPDPEKGLYRATRFDWSGVIGSVQYKGHEYFAYWKDTHDPLFHEDLTGPVEGFIEPGLGYDEAAPGGLFIRLGVGILEKRDEKDYQSKDTYKILDHGKWKIEHGEDWVSFIHEIKSDIGYGYIYKKKITLNSDGFTIGHILRNTGEKTIETDQFNHNFFVIDGAQSGPDFMISFPYPISTKDDLKDILEIKDKELKFMKELTDDNSIFISLDGYGRDIADHQVTVVNQKTGAGVTFNVDKPLHRMVFWACASTLSPENSIWISVKPGEEDAWISEYTLFVNE